MFPIEWPRRSVSCQTAPRCSAMTITSTSVSPHSTRGGASRKVFSHTTDSAMQSLARENFEHARHIHRRKCCPMKKFGCSRPRFPLTGRERTASAILGSLSVVKSAPYRLPQGDASCGLAGQPPLAAVLRLVDPIRGRPRLWRQDRLSGLEEAGRRKPPRTRGSDTPQRGRAHRAGFVESESPTHRWSKLG
jgi:hypothetical protein